MKEYICRVAIVGAQRARVAKVVMLIPFQTTTSDPFIIHANDNVKIRVEYLPCLASFGNYEDESGSIVRYLSNLSYIGSSGNERPKSLAPFFDEERDINDPFPGIAAVAIGCGIEDETDINQIRSFLRTLAGEHFESVLVDSVKPNPEYATMKDETKAFQLMDASQKEEATNLQIIGPGKVAKFVVSLAHQKIQTAFPKPNEPEEDAIRPPGENPLEIEEEPLSIREFDDTGNRYACRMCRRILFDENYLEDPPHQPYKHNFGYRRSGSGRCESFFLASPLDWMGDVSAVEGRFGCPSCTTKLGVWKWAGAQCSCGTWIVPAIQVPCSKVDVVRPSNVTSTHPTILNTVVDVPLEQSEEQLLWEVEEQGCMKILWLAKFL